MKFPSIESLINESKETFKRFPLAILGGILITIFAIALNDYNGASLVREYEVQIGKVIFSLIFAIPIFVSAQTLLERNNIKKIAKLATIILPILYYFFILPEANTMRMTAIEEYRTTILTMCAFASMTFVPFIGKKEPKAFWQYLRTLVFQFALTTFFAIILFGGISLTLLSIDELFQVNIDGSLYLDVWFMIVGIISVWTFLSGIPKDIGKLEKDKNTYALIKRFSKYILLPLLTVYTVVLYAYVGKILITAEWPNGIISWMIIAYSVSGMISLILLNIYKENWIKIYQKIFYALLLPLAVVLFTAISIRISDYGITENRYYVVLLGIWLLAMAVYFLASKRKEIKFIPLTLVIIMVISLFGPWSSFSISEASQLSQLQTLLDQDHEKVEEKHEIQSQIAYIYYAYGIESLKSIDPSLENDLGQIYESFEVKTDDAYYRESAPYISTLAFEKALDQAIDIDGYKHLIEFAAFYDKSAKEYSIGEDTYSISIKDLGLIIKNDRGEVTIDLSEILENLKAKYNNNGWEISAPEMTEVFQSKYISGKLIIERVNYTPSVSIEDITVKLLIN